MIQRITSISTTVAKVELIDEDGKVVLSYQIEDIDMPMERNVGEVIEYPAIDLRILSSSD